MSNIQTLSLQSFMEENRESIRKNLDDLLKTSFRGLDNPSMYEGEMKKLLELKRLPYPRQARAIIAGYNHLKSNKSLLYSSEMGTGKTLMSIALSYLKMATSTKELRFGIMCPTHLVSKWADEIRETLGSENDEYEIHIIKSGKELIALNQRRRRKRVQYIIFSKENAKLSYDRDENCVTPLIKVPYQKNYGYYVCPCCGKIYTLKALRAMQNRAFYFIEEKEYKGSKDIPQWIFDEARGKAFHCKECKSYPNILPKEVCFKNRNKKINRGALLTRLSVADAMRSVKTKGYFDILFVDEAHEMQGEDTLQGNALGVLGAYSKKLVGLTGTLLNGYVSSLFFIMWRFFPHIMKAMDFRFDSLSLFIKRFGSYEKDVTTEENAGSIGSVVYYNAPIDAIGKGAKKESTAINPELIRILMRNVIFLKLDDLNIPLPDYSEEVVLVQPEHNHNYKAYIECLMNEVSHINILSYKFIGALVNDSLSILDLPFKEKKATATYKEVSRTYTYTPFCDESYITNKERKLFELIKAEREVGRKVLVYAHYSNLGTTQRLKDVLGRLFKNEGMLAKIEVLNPSVSPNKRKMWIDTHPCDVLITNPELVKTGLDLYNYPTIIYHQTGYNVQTVRQASRRAWRIGQKSKCKTIFLCYENTAQTIALQLVAKKIKASNEIEGKIITLKNDLSSLFDDAEYQTQNAIANSLLRNDEQKNVEIDLNVWRFQPREMDNFEKYYQGIIDKVKQEIVDAGGNANMLPLIKRAKKEHLIDKKEVDRIMEENQEAYSQGVLFL